MKKEICPAHLSSGTPEARARERKDKKGLCKVSITIRKQTAYHLTQMAASCGGSRDMGRAVDKLVRAHQLSMRQNIEGLDEFVIHRGEEEQRNGADARHRAGAAERSL